MRDIQKLCCLGGPAEGSIATGMQSWYTTGSSNGMTSKAKSPCACVHVSKVKSSSMHGKARKAMFLGLPRRRGWGLLSTGAWMPFGPDLVDTVLCIPSHWQGLCSSQQQLSPTDSASNSPPPSPSPQSLSRKIGRDEGECASTALACLQHLAQSS